MFKLLNKKKIVRQLTRFMHDRNLPDIKPNTPIEKNKIGVKSPMKESIPKLNNTQTISEYNSRSDNSDLVDLLFENKNCK